MAGKVGCGLLLAVLFCAAAVSRAPFVVFLLALAMVFTAFLWWDARTLRRQVTAALQLPAKPVRPGEAFAVTVHLQNAGRRTVPELRAVLRAEDAESGTAIELPCAAMLAPGGRADLRVTLRAAKSGLWRFKLQKLTVRDHLGLFAADSPPDGQTWELCVLPPAEGEADGAGNTPQNRAEQESRAGQDIADGVYDLRPYRVGDPLKQIHWKLTAKVDELTVREPLGTTYRADPAGTLLAEDGGTPPPVLHFGRAAVTRLRTLTRRKAADPDMLVGAGTILHTQQVDQAKAAGADFIVTPGFNPAVVKHCQELGLPVVPGCITPTEIEAGLALGLTTFKFFPSEAMNGMATIKQLCGPYGNIQFIPTAGITMDNLENYLSSDKIAAVGGSFMAPSAMVDAQDWAGITALCKKAVDKSLGFTLAHVGINGESKDEGLGAAEWFNRCFGWPVKEGGRSNFAATYVECCNQRFPGKFGHIGVFTLSMRRALAYFKAHGIATREEFKNVNAKGELVAVYLEEEVGGFAVHIVKKS